MRKNLLWICMSALVMLGCNTKSSSQGDDEKETRELKTEIFKYENKMPHCEASISIEFPVGGDEELGDSIYDFIVATMTEQQVYENDLDDYRNDGQGFVDFFGKYISKDLQEGWETFTDGDETLEDILSENVKYTIVENNDKYVTYLYEYDSYYGGDGFVDRKGATFLKDDCSRVTNEFLFKDSSSQKLITLVCNTLIDNYCKGSEPLLEESELENIDTLPQKPFYATPDGLAFIYGMYEVHWMILEGVIPWDKVKSLLTDEAKELF